MVSRFLAAALTLALTGPGFDGCQGGPSGGTVPPGTTAACFADSDCAPVACEDVRCIGSQCRTVGAMRDGDLDGHAPPPCGDDCDDSDSRVFPGALELCDGRDQDCDSTIDEDAAPGAIATLLGTASEQVSAAAIGDSIVITDTSFTSGVRLRAVDFLGGVGGPVPVTTDPIELVDLASTATGGVVVVQRLPMPGAEHLIETYPVDVASHLVTVHPPTSVASLVEGAQATRVGATGLGTTFAVIWDDAADERWALVPGWASAIRVSTTAGLAPFDVASDGASIAIPTDATTVAFFSVADGSVLGTHSFAGGLAADPLTTTPLDYLVAFHDAFDHELAHMTVATVQPMRAAPSQGSGLPLRVDETALGPLITRFDPTGTHRMGTGVWALLLPETLDSVRADFPPSMVSAGGAGPALDYDVVSSTAGTAVVTNFGSGGAVLTVLACQPR